MTTITKSTTKSAPKAAVKAGPVADSQAALLNAKTAQTEAYAAHAAAVEALDSLGAAMSAGRANVTGAALVTARAEVEVTTARVAAAERTVKRAQQNLRAADLSMAEAVAEVLGSKYGLNVHAVESYPTEAEVPSIYVVQRLAHAANTVTGTLSGSVEILYVRSALHAELDVKAITEALDAGQVRASLRPAGSRRIGAHDADVIRLVVSHAFAPAPVIRDSMTEQQHVLNGAGGNLQSVVRQNLTLQGGMPATVKGHNHHVVKRDIKGATKRTTVEFGLHVVPGGNAWSPAQVEQIIARHVAAQVGRAEAHLGRIVKADVRTIVSESDHRKQVGRVCTFVYESTLV